MNQNLLESKYLYFKHYEALLEYIEQVTRVFEKSAKYTAKLTITPKLLQVHLEVYKEYMWAEDTKTFSLN